MLELEVVPYIRIGDLRLGAGEETIGPPFHISHRGDIYDGWQQILAKHKDSTDQERLLWQSTFLVAHLHHGHLATIGVCDESGRHFRAICQRVTLLNRPFRDVCQELGCKSDQIAAGVPGFADIPHLGLSFGLKDDEELGYPIVTAMIYNSDYFDAVIESRLVEQGFAFRGEGSA